MKTAISRNHARIPDADGDKETFHKAASLEVEFFGGWKAVVIGSIPGVYWVIRKVSNGWIGEILALCLAYAFAAVVVFIWQCFAAGTALKDEEKWDAVLNLLNPAQKKQLQFLVNDGKMRVGQMFMTRSRGVRK